MRKDRRGRMKLMRLRGEKKEGKLVMEGKWKTDKGGGSSMDKSDPLFS